GASGPPSPAPVVLGGAAPRVVAEPRGEPAGGVSPRGDTRRVVVAHGQSLSVLAHAYRVPASVIIAANHLTPPYKIETGKQLLIPGSANAPTPTPIAAAAPAGPIAQGHPPPEIIPLDGPAPAPKAPPEPSAAEEAR